MADTLTDIHAAVGELLNAADVPETGADASVDDTIDAELDAKTAGDELDTEPEPAEPEPTDPAEPVADGEGEPEPETPDPFAAALEASEPFNYTVDGTPKAYDGLRVVKGADGQEWGIAPKQAFAGLQDRLQRGEYLETQNKALYEKVRQFDAVTVPDRATGAEHKGFAAVEHLVVENARQHAALQLMAETIENPEKLIALAISVQNGDMSGIQAMTDRLRLIAENATYKTKATFSERLAKARETETAQQDRASVTGQAIKSAITQWAAQFPALTKDDLAKAEAHFAKLGSAIVRPATPDEVKAAAAHGVTLRAGELAIDHPVIYEWLADRAELRKQAATASTAAEKAATENAARLAASKRGTKTPATATKPKPKATVPDDTEETWAQQKARLMSGNLGGTSDD